MNSACSRNTRVVLLVGTVLILAGTLQGQTRLSSQQAFDAAKKMYDDGKWTDGLTAFQNFERDYKFSIAVPQAVYYEGWCCFNLKRYQEAAKAFERVVNLYPDANVVPEAMLKRAECLRELKNFNGAADLYREFQVKFPKHQLLPQALLGDAWTRFKLNELANAQAIAQRVRDDYPDDPAVNVDALYLLGQILTAKDEPDAAQVVYRQMAAQRFNPRATEALYRVGESMFNAKRYADAIAYYQLVEPKAALLTNVLQQIAGAESNQSSQARPDSLRQLRARIDEYPDLGPLALFRVGNCYQALRKPGQAAVAYRKVLDQYPDDMIAEQANFALIQTLVEARQFDRALAEIAKFTQKYPKSQLLENALFLQAETMFGQEQYRDALDHYLKLRASARDPQMLETIEYRIGACQYGLKEFDKARESLAQFVQKFKQSQLMPDALFRLGRSCFEIANASSDPKVSRQNLADAVKSFEDVRANYPSSDLLADVTLQLGYFYSQLGEHDKAIATFTEFTTKWPDHRRVPDAIYQIARNHVAAQHYDDAIVAYTELVRRLPNTELAPTAAYEIGTTYAAAKRTADMIAAFRFYTEKYPDHSRVGDALYAIGQQLESEKKLRDATRTYRDLVARAAANPSGPMRDAAIAAELRIATVLEPKDAIVDCEGFLAKFASEPVATRAAVTEIAALYRNAKSPADGYAKLDQLAAQYHGNPAIQVATKTSTIELATGEEDYERAYAVALKLLADSKQHEIPASGYLAIGNAMLKTLHFSEARDAFDKVLKFHPDDARATALADLGLGQAQLGLKNLDQAEAIFQKLLIANPQNLDAKLGLGQVHESRGDVKEAVAAYDPVWRDGDGEVAAEAAFRVGMLAFQQKNYRAALPMFTRLLFATGPQAEEAAFRAAQCHEALGQIEQARSAYQAYLRRFPNGAFTMEARALLAKLPVPPA